MAGLCLVGCAAIAGVGDGETIDGSPELDGGVPALEDGPAPDGGPCVAKRTASTGGVIRARRATAAPKLDGEFADWACVDRIDVGKGAFEKGMPDGGQSLEFAFQWTEAAVWFYAHAVTAQPAGTNTGDLVFTNDSVHLIIGAGDPPATGVYRDGDHQITFDHSAQIGDYKQGIATGVTIPARVTTTRGPGPIDFEIEARIDATLLKVPPFAANQKLFVNLQLVDNKGATNIGFRLWRTPACGCKAGCCERIGNVDSPTCNLRCTEVLQLD